MFTKNRISVALLQKQTLHHKFTSYFFADLTSQNKTSSETKSLQTSLPHLKTPSKMGNSVANPINEMLQL